MELEDGPAYVLYTYEGKGSAGEADGRTLYCCTCDSHVDF